MTAYILFLPKIIKYYSTGGKKVENTTQFQLVAELLEFQARDNPTKVAIIQKNKKMNYYSLNEKANQFANFLLKIGVETGDRVVLKGENSIDLIIAIFGCVKAGAVFVPLHPETADVKLDYVIKNCEAKVLITNSEVENIHPNQSLKTVILFSDNHTTVSYKSNSAYLWKQTLMFETTEVRRDLTGRNIAAIIYTSGSTGYSKGVVELHENILFATTAINRVIKNTAEDVILCGLPLSFDYGLYQLFLSFEVGATIVLEKNFSIPMAIPKLLLDYNVTGLPLIPSLAAMLLSTGLLERIELPNLRYITSTGDVFPSTQIKRFGELFAHVTVFPMYGLTECKRVSILPKGQINGHEQSVGKPLPGTKVFVVDSKGKKLPPGDIGELVVEGPHVMAGYWGDDEETSQRFRFDDATGKVLLYTKDLFKMDCDGFLYYVGRDEMIIKCRGHRVSAAEIETTIARFDGVREVGVVGIEWPVVGQEICVCVSCKDSHEVTIESIRECCKQHLIAEICPKYVFTIESPLPKTENGKIDRRQLKNILEQIVIPEKHARNSGTTATRLITLSYFISAK